jgi:hypothetical protein
MNSYHRAANLTNRTSYLVPQLRVCIISLSSGRLTPQEDTNYVL